MNTSKKSIYNLSVYSRILIVIFVLIASTLSIAIALPLAKFLNLDLSELQGQGFNPTFKVLTVVILYASFQFFLIWLVMRFIHQKALGSLGFKGSILVPLLIGTAFGMIWVAAEYLLLHFFSSNISIVLSIPQGVSVLTIIGYFLLNVLFLLTLNSLKEELVFRAYPISQFDDYPQLMIPIIILVSLVFASVHHILVPFALDDFVSRFTIALVLSFVFYRWRSIWLIVGIHNGLNLFEYLTGGNYQIGGLLKLAMENDPSLEVSIAIDLGLAIIFILIFNCIWKKEKQSNKMFLRIKHPVANKTYTQ